MVRIALAFLLMVGGAARADMSPKALVETTDIGGLAVSPDGHWLAFRTRRAETATNRYRVRWHVVPTDLSAPSRVVADGGEPLWTDAGAPVNEPPVWLPDSRSFVFRALFGGAVGLWQASPTTTAAAALAHDEADIRAFSVDPASGRITYRVGAPRAAIVAAEEREYADGILVDASVDMAQSVYRGAMINGRHATQRFANTWFARQGLLADAPEREITIEVPGRAGAPVIAPVPTPSGTAFDGSRAVIEPDEQGRCVSIAGPAADRSGPALTVRRCFKTRVASIAWWPGRAELLVTLQDSGFAQTLVTVSPARRPIRGLARSSGLLAGSENPAAPCALGRDAAFCVAATAGDPPMRVRLARRGGQHTIVYVPNRGMMTGYTGTVRRIDWHDAAGVHFSGQLFLPAHARRVPFFITYYRCPGFVRGGLGDEWPLATFADAGIAALCVNKPPDPGGGTEAQPSYDLALSGVTAIIDALARAGTIDRARVGMGGLSFGSEVTMWTAMRSGLLRAASIASLQLEPAYYWMNGIAGRDNHEQLARTWGLGAPDATPAQWRLMSPALNVDRLDAAILMQLPEQEARTTMELYARLSHAPTPAELYVFPDEPHILIQPVHRLAAYERNLDWFRFWLQDRADPATGKVAQYRRWRTLAARWRAAQSRQARAQSSIPTSSNSRK